MSPEDPNAEHAAGHQPNDGAEASSAAPPAAVELPRPTAAPLALAVGITLLATGVATSLAMSAVGLVVCAAALGAWVRDLLPHRGHVLEPLAPPEHRPRTVAARVGQVPKLRAGMPGYRLRLPVKVHPISAGIKGGLVGGLVMPVPALLYGVLSGHGIWYPVNLLAGMVLPGLDQMTVEQLDQFHPLVFILAASIHLTVSLLFGLMLGVLLPTLPDFPKAVSWGALLMPSLWTGASFLALSFVSPVTRTRVVWPWFVLSQFCFGLVAAVVFMRAAHKFRPVTAGLLGGAAGGLVMPLPAILWGWLSGHGIWYPVNLLSGMVIPHADQLTVAALERFRGEWFLGALAVHVLLSLSFGLAYGIVLPHLPKIPGPVAWGSLVMPLLWMATSYSLMGIVNPLLQQRVDWPWFVVSQFVFGLAAAIVVVRSETIAIPPAGPGATEGIRAG